MKLCIHFIFISFCYNVLINASETYLDQCIAAGIPKNVATIMAKLEINEQEHGTRISEKRQTQIIALLQSGSSAHNVLSPYLDIAYKWKDETAVAALTQFGVKKEA